MISQCILLETNTSASFFICWLTLPLRMLTDQQRRLWIEESCQRLLLVSDGGRLGDIGDATWDMASIHSLPKELVVDGGVERGVELGIDAGFICVATKVSVLFLLKPDQLYQLVADNFLNISPCLVFFLGIVSCK